MCCGKKKSKKDIEADRIAVEKQKKYNLKVSKKVEKKRRK